METNKPETLCFRCGNSCGGCSWSDRFEPVDGWRAAETIVKGDRGPLRAKQIQSFIVQECPKHKTDKPLRAESVCDQGVKHLLYAMLNRLVSDYANAVIRIQAETNSDKAVGYQRTIKEIESYVSTPIFEDIVDMLEFGVNGQKLLDLIQTDPVGVIKRLNANPENVKERPKDRHENIHDRKESNYAY